MQDNIIKSAFKIFTLKQKTNFIILVFLSSISSILEMLGIFLILPITAILFDIQEATKYENFYNFFIIIQNNFGGNFKVITILILIAVFTIKFIFLFFTKYFEVKFLNSINADLDSQILLSKLKSEFKDFNLFKIKNFTIPILKETSFFTQHALRNALIIIADLPLVIFFLIILYIENSFVFLIIIFSFSLVTIFYFLVIRKKINSHGSKRYELEQSRLEILTKIFNSIRDIKLYDKQNYFYKNYEKASEKYFGSLTSILTLSNLPRIFLEYFFILLISFLIIIFLISSDNLVNNIHFFAFLVVSVSRLAPLLNRLVSAIQQIKFFMPSSEYVVKTVKKNLSLENKKIAKSKVPFQKEINLKNFYFRYSVKSKYIFKNLNIKIKKNKITGILGESGSGKSTLINIISGLIYNKSRNFLFDDNVIDKEIAEGLHSKFAIISQSSNLIFGSIKENIAFGENSRNLDMKKIIKVSKEAGIHDFINKLPQKYETILTEKISNISGGQKQRIEIARALYFNREILVLDESTSALDNQNEQIVIKTLKKLSSSKTIIFITHDRKRVNFCSHIYKISNKKANLLK